MIPNAKLKAMQAVRREFQDISNNPILNIGAQVGLINPNNIMEWKCTMVGPSDTPYAGGLFYLKVKFPDNYPTKPPEVSFLTPIYHINVNPNAPLNFNQVESLGHVCISTLNWWKPTSNMREVLNDIFALFYLANPKSPYGMERAAEFLQNRQLYENKCRYFTQKYAAMNLDEKSYTGNWDFSYPQQ